MPTYNDIFQAILTEYDKEDDKKENLSLYTDEELDIEKYSDEELSSDKAEAIRQILRDVAHKGGCSTYVNAIENVLGALQGSYGLIGAKADSYEVIAVSNMTKPDQKRLDALVSAVEFDSQDKIVLLGQAGIKNFEIIHRIYQTTGSMPKLVIADISSDTVVFWSALRATFNDLKENDINALDLALKLPERMTLGRETVAEEIIRIREGMGRTAFAQILKDMKLTQANWEAPKLFTDLADIYSDAQFIVWSSDIGSFADPTIICENLSKINLKYLLSCDHVEMSNPKDPQLFDLTRHTLLKDMLSQPSQVTEAQITPITTPPSLVEIDITESTDYSPPTRTLGGK